MSFARCSYEHHCYITFHTNIAGVEMSARLKERYPDHVTIVLQNQFWDLVVEEDHFAVTLSFSDIPERLVIPFTALKAFYDPVASFEANFEIVWPDSAPEQGATVFVPKAVEEDPQENSPAAIPIALKKKAPVEAVKSPNKPEDGKQTPKLQDDAPEDEQGGAQVVSLDAFRKK